MMRAGDIVVLENGVLRQGVRDADTEDSRGFSVVFDNQKYRCFFEDEGTRWTRGTLDSPAARALLTVASLRSEMSAVCSDCGANLVCIYGAPNWSCPNCGALYP